MTEAGSFCSNSLMEGAEKAIWKNYKLQAPACVKSAIEAYREQNDWLAPFIEECCDTAPAYETKSGELYNAYRAYCQASGEYVRSSTTFSEALDSIGYDRKRKNSGVFIIGLRLKNTAKEGFL